MLPFHKWCLCFQFCNSNPFSYGSFLSSWVARLWPVRFWWRSTWGISFQKMIPWILFQQVTPPPASASCVSCVWRYTRFHLVCQNKLHLPLARLYLLLTDNTPREPLISSWIGHQTDKVLLSLYSYSEMNTAAHLLHLASVASVNEFYLFFLLERSFYNPLLSLFDYAVFVSHTTLFLFDQG